jgi:hypothetical protein
VRLRNYKIGGVSIKYGCCFCGKGVEESEFIALTAHWGDNQWQFWGAHGRCLARLIEVDAREGPLLETFGV